MRRRVRAGQVDQRDRATKRRRDRGSRPTAARSCHDALRALIESLAPDIEVETYLRATHAVELPAAERLRILAIERETDLPFHTLQELYERAIALDPDAPWVYASFGIAASEHARVADDEGTAARLHQLAHTQLERASMMAPDDPDIAAALGLATYMDPSRGPQNALASLERALELNPRQAWARLYRAHALHDLERWEGAARAYAEVPKDAFDGPRSWRTHLLVEQRAFCRLQAGDREGALADFERILGRYEAQPHLARWGDLRYARVAAHSGLPQLRARVDALARRLDSED